MTPAPASSSASGPRLGAEWWVLLPALPLLGIGLLGTAHAGDGATAVEPPGAPAYVLMAVAALALLLRRRAPVVTVAVCALAIATYLALRYPFGPILLTGPAAAYALGARLPWRPAVRWGAGFVAVTVPAAAPQFLGRDAPGYFDDTGAGGWVGYLLWAAVWAAVVAAPAAVAGAVRVRRRSEAGVRAEQARRAVSEERLTMAQDVHDGVGHGLAVIAMHAGVALHVFDRDPARARELLTSILATSRESLDGLRADLARLRSDGPGPAAARRPEPGLDDLPVLLARMRDGGLVLRERIDPPGEVPADVDAAAYRIVQESLTNVLRHAGDTPAEVRVARAGDALVVEVRDRGRAVPGGDVGAGSGIAGMRRRALAVGGRLEAGPAVDGGFRVRADLPLAGAGPADGPGSGPGSAGFAGAPADPGATPVDRAGAP